MDVLNAVRNYGHLQEVVIVKAVKCLNCRKLHEADSDTFMRIVGSIYIGENGGVIGNGTNTSETIFCRDTCFVDAMTNIAGF